MVSVLQHIGLVFFYIVLFAFNLLIFLGVPGGWIALVAILIFDIATGFSTVGWVLLLVMAGLVLFIFVALVVPMLRMSSSL